jgi:hypothetical protein
MSLAASSPFKKKFYFNVKQKAAVFSRFPFCFARGAWLKTHFPFLSVQGKNK